GYSQKSLRDENVSPIPLGWTSATHSRFQSRSAGYCRKGSASGFSLVEVMIAILILGIALAGMVHGLTTALASSKESELQTNAALLAAAQVESLRAEGFI